VESSQGVIIAGRQHSGNSVLCKILGRSEPCLVDCGESTWFEHASNVKAGTDSRAVLKRAVELLPNTFACPPDRLDAVRAELFRQPKVGTYRPYTRILDAVTSQRGRTHWVLKGTSFIFYAPEVLGEVPSVKVVYLIRNPLDVVASTYKRVQRTLQSGDHLLYGDWLFSPLLGWRRGIDLATGVKERFPERVRLVRYEDMVQTDGVVEQLFDFVGVPFDPSYLQVSHVNQSDHPTPGTDQETKRKGLNASRVGYYSEVLSESQLRAVRSLLPRDRLQTWYPDLDVSAIGSGSWGKAQVYRLQCGGRLLNRCLRKMMNSPVPTLHRVWKRVVG